MSDTAAAAVSAIPSMRTYLELTLANVAYIDAADAAKPATAFGYEPSSFNHKYTTLGGHRYHYVEEGDPNGQTLVLIHGFPDLWYGWRYQIRHLAKQGYYVIAVDDLGSGESDQPKCVGLDVAPYSSKNLARNLTELLDQLNIDKAVFIGHDWGAYVAWKTGMHFPQRCHAVISVGNPLMPATAVAVGPKELAAKNPSFFYMPELEGPEIESWFDGKTLSTAYFNMIYGGRAGTNAEEKKYYIDTFTRTSFHGAFNYYRAWKINHHDELPYVGKPYTVPSLFIKAESDEVLTPAYVDAVPKDFFVDLEQSSIVPGGHNVHTEAPEELNQELTRFLTKLFDDKLKLGKTKTKQQEQREKKEGATCVIEKY
ncbi:Bifunctional epoxide hydrolase 2 [Mortierella sp. GBA35]|nr:Bifunctional epoxide hydrolase 2 [Mortierella sp. GBA35]